MVRLLIVINFCLIVNLFAEEKDTITILALGDSITEGYQGAANYRPYLINILNKEDKEYKFIGPKKDQTSHHAGYSGQNSSHLGSIISKIYRSHSADIVLIHTGHNHFAKDKPTETILSDTKTIITSIHQINPQAKVLLATVIPSGKLPKYSYIPKLNKELKKFIQSTQGVFLVDQAEGFDWEKDTIKDKVHPNSHGANKMALKWFDQIKIVSQKTRNIIDKLPKNEEIALAHASRVLTYKTIDNLELKLHLFKEKDLKPHDKRPVILFIHGGGWTHGTPSVHSLEALYFSQLGLVCASISYRLINKHTKSPADCLSDAKSAIRFLRKHAEKFNIDPNKIIVCGGSAGAHLAASLNLLTGHDDPKDDLNISCASNAMILLYPAFDLVDGWHGGMKLCHQVGINPKTFSPAQNVNALTPPTLILSGSKDPISPTKVNLNFLDRMRHFNNSASFIEYQGKGHKLFERSSKDPYFRATLFYMENFLFEQKFLSKVSSNREEILVKKSFSFSKN